MPATITLSDGDSITYKDAENRDDNIVLHAASSVALQDFMWRQKHVIEALARHHLKLGDRDSCVAAGPQQWIRGAINVCVPVEVKSANQAAKLFIFRCPMPHELAEARDPGTFDEKTACEVGTHVWMQEQCPLVRIPRLYGFGFSDGRCRPFYVRVARILQRSLHRCLRYTTVLPRYVSNPSGHRLPTAYMLLEYKPFSLELTDVNRSNIFVDRRWNVTCLIDLEWICALPVEALAVPYWLTGHAVNKISEPEFDSVQRSFIQAVEEEERKRTPVGGGLPLASAMEENWHSGASWLWTAVHSSAMYSLVWKHIYPRFPVVVDRVQAEAILSGFWREDSAQVVQKKANEFKEYKYRVASLFTSNPGSAPPASSSPAPGPRASSLQAPSSHMKLGKP
ncbi:uncharacterized protein E0L32_005028 [Thyridium curvatum]|uniref:Aminoglycoside phosphotransferase domain-containing protein n=1 Tax=Thyridium curvatum TaxID=1093900 RepID=A0A507BBZ2_9PEZI|nr:uncharacterized protein E0L32_005028 [Thyridium curvatum]TPX14919.1 hypothetical protein E0L32_005028 [Thyridium curvatum]